MAASPKIERYSGSATTSSTSLTTLVTCPITITGTMTVKVHAHIVGREPSSGEAAAYEGIATYKNDTGSTLVQVGSTTDLHDVDEDTNNVFSFGTSSSNVLVQVTPTGDTTAWSAWAEVTYLVV